MRRVLVLSALVVGWLLASATASLADPAGPTHYDSVVTEVVRTDGQPVNIEVEVLGGDAFVVMRVTPGRRVEVPRYDDEPYLCFNEDGTVEINQRSPSRWLNDARYGAQEVDIPPHADADAGPQWQPVADGGQYA